MYGDCLPVFRVQWVSSLDYKQLDLRVVEQKFLAVVKKFIVAETNALF